MKARLYRISLLLSVTAGALMLYVMASLGVPDAFWSGCRFFQSEEFLGCGFIIYMWIVLISLPLAVVSAVVRVISRPSQPKKWWDMLLWAGTLIIVFAGIIKGAYWLGLSLSIFLFAIPLVLLILHMRQKPFPARDDSAASAVSLVRPPAAPFAPTQETKKILPPTTTLPLISLIKPLPPEKIKRPPAFSEPPKSSADRSPSQGASLQP